MNGKYLKAFLGQAFVLFSSLLASHSFTFDCLLNFYRSGDWSEKFWSV